MIPNEIASRNSVLSNDVVQPEVLQIDVPDLGNEDIHLQNVSEAGPSSTVQKEAVLLPPCSCKKKCFDKIGHDIRETILKKYNNYKFSEKRWFLDKYVGSTPVKRTKVGAALNKKKTILYFLPNSDEERISVCKPMFLHTIGKKADSVITEYFKSKDNFGFVETVDHRGAKIAETKKNAKIENDKIIKAHIETFQPVSSHYKLLHAPNRRYLPLEIKISDMHADFCTKHPKISYQKYRNVFATLNIGFSTPSQDECPKCSKYTQHCTDQGNLFITV